MSEINFKPIFDYIDQKSEETVQELKAEMATKADIDKVLTAIDGLAKRSKENDDGILVLEKKTERLEHWTIRAAEKIKVPYKP